MTREEERKKRRQRKKIFRTVFISFIFIYIILRSVPSLMAGNAKTILPEKSILVEEFSAQGFMIKNETVYKSNSSGNLELYYDEGERLPVGSKVASISGISDSSSLEQELEQINKSILALEQSEADTEIIDKDTEKVDDILESLTEELQELINEKKFDEIYLLKEKISVYNNKSKGVSHTDTLIEQSLENLKSRKEDLSSEINSSNVNYHINQAGILSYDIDGYEQTYIPKDFENYSYDKLKLEKIDHKNKKDQKNIDIDQPIYKIIDSFEWYMAIKIEDLNNIEGYENGNTVRIEMKDDGEELRGEIVSINISKEKGVIVIKFNTKLHDYYHLRFPEVSFIKNKVDSFKIPNKAIVEQDSIKGVYVKGASGVVNFKPVEILSENEKYTYVSLGDSNSQIEVGEKEEKVKTITIFDEIFTRTRSLRDGQILN